MINVVWSDRWADTVQVLRCLPIRKPTKMLKTAPDRSKVAFRSDRPIHFELADKLDALFDRRQTAIYFVRNRLRHHLNAVDDRTDTVRDAKEKPFSGREAECGPVLFTGPKETNL